jgi:biopolymer transport protein ExbD
MSISSPTPDWEGSTERDDDPAILAEINITPLTDVFLVLLIIFMVGASISVDAQREATPTGPTAEDQQERGLQINTPEGTGSEMLVPKDVVVSVMPDGVVYVDEEQVPLDQLGAKLGGLAKGSASARVVIRGDEKASYKTIMSVISTARKAGMTDVALSTRTSGP